MNDTSRSTTRRARWILAGLAGGFALLGASLMTGPSGSVVASSPAAPADKPLWKAKGTPTGPIHGSEDGTPFKDKARGRLAEVSARGGDWLDSVRCTWDDEGELEKGDAHGGDGGEETILKLEPGESLIQITGVVLKQDDFTVIGSLTIKTTKRTVGPVGRTLDGPKFTLDAPKDQEICGFQGRQGDYLNAVGMICRPTK